MEVWLFMILGNPVAQSLRSSLHLLKRVYKGKTYAILADVSPNVEGKIEAKHHDYSITT